MGFGPSALVACTSYFNLPRKYQHPLRSNCPWSALLYIHCRRLITSTYPRWFAWISFGTRRLDQSCELGCNSSNTTPQFAAYGFFRRYSSGLPYDRGDTEPLDKHQRTRLLAARFGNPFPEQPRSTIDVCPPHGFRRRSDERHAG